MSRKVWFISLSVFITVLSVALGVTVFQSSYLRLWETLCALGTSVKYYGCEVFGIEHSTHAGITDISGVLKWEQFLPKTTEDFKLKANIFFSLFIQGGNLKAFWLMVGKGVGNVARYIVLFLPFVLLFVLLIKKAYATPNTKHNQDTKPLKAFKWVMGKTYHPIKRFIKEYAAYVERDGKWKTAWIVIWALNFNLASMIVAFVAYYLYFSVSFDVKSLYGQVCNLILDTGLVLKHFPWFITGTVAWLIFNHIRENIARSVLQHHEARNCGFIKELPIVSMSCGSMGKKKTTLTTDMSLSQTVMFRQEAFIRLQKQDMKFPFFPWIKFEKELQSCMEYGRVYNLASIRTWVAQKRERYEKHGNVEWQLYGYDVERYGLYYDSGLKEEYLFDVLETYAKLYFIYVIESSLLVANYSIREEDILYDSGNFPMRTYGFFSPAVEYTRFAHILDFDVLRLGKKVIADNPKAGSFEFGVVVITEIGKERANMLELKEMKKGADEANQKNDLFNAWLKMCRHSATVDNFPFIKVFVDEQRPESWGADARDLCDILTIVSSGEERLAMPFYTIEEMLCEWAFAWFIDLYYELRFLRGDNTLFMHLLKWVVSKIWAHNERIYNKFGYCVLSIEKERGTQDSKPQKKRYFLANYKIYRDRFSTDCFSDYFNDLAEKSGVGLMDYRAYASVKASVEELKAQNSYFIRDLYGK
ncbi:MAG: hypothetical protein E7349_00070 [Clostridiales bacterium]|nr:hypothetical protein [Clostridiales bacterium]